jgi:hypothetical protein
MLRIPESGQSSALTVAAAASSTWMKLKTPVPLPTSGNRLRLTSSAIWPTSKCVPGP